MDGGIRSSRLGIFQVNQRVENVMDNSIYLSTLPERGLVLPFERGSKRYELTNHLGNVLATISDRKIAVTSTGSLIDYYEAEVISANDYYPFGMMMPGRKFSASDSYRYGFNGKEQDHETTGTTTYDYGYRIYNPALGKFLSVDPLTKDYPWYTPYQFAGNKPIQYIDLDGLEEAPPKTPYNLRTTAEDYEFHDSQDPNDKYASTTFKDEIWPSTLERYDGTWTYTRYTSGQTFHYWLNSNNEWQSYEPVQYSAPAMPRNMLYHLFVEPLERAFNPVDNFDAYVSASFKKKVNLSNDGVNGLTGTVIIGGVQGGFTSKNYKGFYGNMLLGDNSYFTYTRGKTEIRGLPLKGMLNLPMDGTQPEYGDFAPQLRVLHQVGSYRGIPIQAEIALGVKPTIGLRAKLEASQFLKGYNIPFDVEVATGGRFSFKVPGLFSALFNK